MKRYFWLVLFIFAGAGCGTGPADPAQPTTPKNESLTVSAAVSLKDAFNEIGALFEARTGRSISFNFGASGTLQKQIETGAPVDVFASAGTPQMDELAAKDLIDTAARRDFARNSLVLIVPAESKIAVASFADLTGAEVQKIAVGNPKTVPAGIYSDQVLEKLNLKDSLRSKLIPAEDVRQVLDYVVRGEADAGLVYATDARVAGPRVRVAATAAEDTHVPIFYPIAIIKDSRRKQAAQELIDLILSAEGQNILEKYGFTRMAER